MRNWWKGEFTNQDLIETRCRREIWAHRNKYLTQFNVLSLNLKPQIIKWRLWTITIKWNWNICPSSDQKNTTSAETHFTTKLAWTNPTSTEAFVPILEAGDDFNWHWTWTNRCVARNSPKEAPSLPKAYQNSLCYIHDLIDLGTYFFGWIFLEKLA